MIYQIAGIVIVTVSLICGTWYAVTVRKEQAKAQQNARKARQARNERDCNNEWMILYEEEKQRRIDAETREMIAKTQLERTRDRMAKIKLSEVK